MNVLVALAWPNHVHHRAALHWFARIRDGGWATCPTTESGFARVSSNQRALPDARTPHEAMELLARLTEVGDHHFWPDGTSLAVDTFGVFRRVVGHRQVTDAHLLTLAIRMEGVLSTFDRAVGQLAADRGSSVELIDA